MKLKMKNDTNAVSPVIGVILMVAITVVLAAVVFMVVVNMTKNTPGELTTITLVKDNDEFIIASASEGLSWDQLTVSGCAVHPTTGLVEAGQVIKSCTDKLRIVDTETNVLIYKE